MRAASLTGMSSAGSSLTSVPQKILSWPVAALLSVVAVVAAGVEPRALPLVYIAAVTPALWSTDVLSRRLPNRLVLPGYLAAGGGLTAQWLVTGEPPLLALGSGVAYFAFMFALGLTGGMGMGDVKLAGVLGLAAGALGPVAALVSPLTAFLLGGVAAMAALRRGAGARIPFGPFLLAGFWIAVVLSRL